MGGSGINNSDAENGDLFSKR